MLLPIATDGKTSSTLARNQHHTTRFMNAHYKYLNITWMFRFYLVVFPFFHLLPIQTTIAHIFSTVWKLIKLPYLIYITKNMQRNKCEQINDHWEPDDRYLFITKTMSAEELVICSRRNRKRMNKTQNICCLPNTQHKWMWAVNFN